MAGRGQAVNERLTFTAALKQLDKMSAGWVLEGGSQGEASLPQSDDGPGWRPWVVGSRTEFAKSETGCTFILPRNGGTVCA